MSEKEHDCLHLHRMVVIALLLLIDLQKFGHFHHVSSVTNLVIKLVAGECNKTDYMHTARVFSASL